MLLEYKKYKTDKTNILITFILGLNYFQASTSKWGGSYKTMEIC